MGLASQSSVVVNTLASARARAVAWLLQAQGRDGGWGYRPAGTSFVEPTALVLLALLHERTGQPEAEAAARRAVHWLRQTQRSDGSWGISPLDDSPSWMTAYAVWALAVAQRALRDDSLQATLEAALDRLLADAAPAVTSEKAVEEARRLLAIDVSLVGWPWLQGDSHFVFPTAVAIIAACVAGRSGAVRVEQALAFLRDRVCQGGGWNVGNPYMLGKAFAPTVIDTAAALMALAAAGQGGSVAATEGRARLVAMSAGTVSPLGLAWGICALLPQADGLAELRSSLVARQAVDGSWQLSPFTTALGILALGDRMPL